MFSLSKKIIIVLAVAAAFAGCALPDMVAFTDEESLLAEVASILDEETSPATEETGSGTEETDPGTEETDPGTEE
ncbi:MAG: hypothetical protein HN368_19780, partial [Spirochaetales bacterium]|nr:hypothetical protein [Spirochaetales bacterium]